MKQQFILRLFVLSYRINHFWYLLLSTLIWFLPANQSKYQAATNHFGGLFGMRTRPLRFMLNIVQKRAHVPTTNNLISRCIHFRMHLYPSEKIPSHQQIYRSMQEFYLHLPLRYKSVIFQQNPQNPPGNHIGGSMNPPETISDFHILREKILVWLRQSHTPCSLTSSSVRVISTKTFW